MTTISRPAKWDPPPSCHAPAGPDPLNGQRPADSQASSAVEGPSSPQAIDSPPPNATAPAGTQDTLNGQTPCDTQRRVAVEGKTPPQAKVGTHPNANSPAGEQAAPPASESSTPNGAAPEGRQTAAVPDADFPSGQAGRDPHLTFAAGEQAPPAAKSSPVPTDPALLADPFLSLAADVLDDMERVRIANENRLRQLAFQLGAEDEEEGGKKLLRLPPDIHPHMLATLDRLAGIVKRMRCDSDVVLKLTGEKTPKRNGCCLEHDAEKNLVKQLRQHPLYGWVSGQRGVGDKQAARMLAAIGDPYMRPAVTDDDGNVLQPARPRRGPDELKALCGWHTRDGVVPRRQKGVKANWSGTAKKRVWLVAVSCLKQPSGSRYRDAYDAGRAKYTHALHTEPCARCGPSGKPAQPGSPLSAGHQHQRAVRIVCQDILKDLWREAKRIHEQGGGADPQP